ncbi:MAG: hypothetical protein P0107_01075 [Nitrosomonas sp.]|nr:hypothetical protein [Nitrosomonas sp.]
MKKRLFQSSREYSLAATRCHPVRIPSISQATYHHDNENAPWIFVKGAPERILDMCTTQLQQNGEQMTDIEYWQRMVSAYGC